VDEERIEVLERIGAYAAGELSEEEARETERLLREDPDQRRTAEAYNRMFVLLSVMQQEAPEAPPSVVNHAIRRAYVSAFFRQAEELFVGLGRAYAGAFVYYLGLRGEAAGGGT
jgi:anti-sigma-K factor RskA